SRSRVRNPKERVSAERDIPRGGAMDKTTEKIARYATSLSYEDLTPAALRATKKLLVDTIGCAIGAHDSEPARIARRVAAGKSSARPARVWCSGERSSIEAAAFANGVMVRYL